VQVPLNDSLTAFRIVAIASAGGIVRHGQHGYPQLAGPDLDVGLADSCAKATAARTFTVRNTSAASLGVDLNATAEARRCRARA
jgi:hypothetical protein